MAVSRGNSIFRKPEKIHLKIYVDINKLVVDAVEVLRLACLDSWLWSN